MLLFGDFLESTIWTAVETNKLRAIFTKNKLFGGISLLGRSSWTSIKWFLWILLKTHVFNPMKVATILWENYKAK